MKANPQEKILTAHKFNVDEYEKMVETGCLTERDNVELINGKIINMTPIGKRHAACVTKITKQFYTVCTDQVLIRVQDPIQLPPNSEPEPDIAVTTPEEDYYASNHPTPDDIVLLIEVAETSLEFDRKQKIPLYAESEIKEVWLVNLEQDTIEQYRFPSGETYDQVNTFTQGDQISLAEFPEISLDVEYLLPDSE